MTSFTKPKTIALKPPARLSGDINVTPLIDVVLVLLIIFMVITPLLEKDILVQVPKTEKVEEPQLVPPDQLVVRVTPSGDLLLNGTKVEAAAYLDTLKARLDRRPENDRVVFVMADDDANYGAMVRALDGAKNAGAKTLGVATDDPDAPAPTTAPTP